MNNMVSHKK